MKANPGGPVTGNAIIGREKEISQIWHKLQIRSVLLASERRVGKTCVLRKMADHPVDGWTPVQAFVESARHPIECVEKIYTEANQMEVRSSRGVWLGRIKSALQSMAGSEVAGLKFPPIQKNWKQLLDALAEDIADNMDKRVLIMVDEFPLMVNNVIEDHGPGLGMEVLDSLREIRQKYEPSGRVRFLLIRVDRPSPGDSAPEKRTRLQGRAHQRHGPGGPFRNDHRRHGIDVPETIG